MISNWSELSAIKNRLRNLPDMTPPQELRVNSMEMLPDQKKPWYRRIVTPGKNGWTDMSFFLRGAVATASLVLAFYGGTKFESFNMVHRTVADISAESDSGMSGEAYFYLGRSLLASDRPAEALDAFQKAEMLQPDNPQYTLWQGAAYQFLGDIAGERQSYQRLINRRPGLLAAKLNLAHNLLQSGDVSRAGLFYQQVLLQNPGEKSALYNRALVFRMQNDSVAEARSWREYLDNYRTGKKADRALQYLQESGDYSYRRYQLGYKSIILNQKRLLGSSEPEQNQEMNFFIRQLPRQDIGKIDIAVFFQGDVSKAEKMAKILRKKINRKIQEKTVRASWFGVAEPVKTGNQHEIKLPEGLLIFSSPVGREKKEERI